jgi:hypothetical protein
MLENPNYFFTVSHNFASLQCFIFLISLKEIIILSIFGSILKFYGKSVDYQLFSMPDIDTGPTGRIRIGISWMAIRIRIQQNDADPTRSVS